MMENSEVEEDGEFTVAVAVSESKNSKFAVKWALDKFVPEGINLVKLLHVLPKSTTISTPIGSAPTSQVLDDSASASKEMDWKTNVMLLPYKQLCSERQVEAEAVVIEAEDIADAISAQISKFRVSKLVIGSSSRSAFSRKFKAEKTSSKILECAPCFCSVYVVSKGKLLSTRPSTSSSQEINVKMSSPAISSGGFSSHNSVHSSDFTDTDSSPNVSRFYSTSLYTQRDQALRTLNQNWIGPRTSSESIHQHSGSFSLSLDEDASSTSSGHEVHSGISRTSSYRSIKADQQSWSSDVASSSNDLNNCSTSENQVDINLELERLRFELKHMQGLYQMAQNETVDASLKLHELSARHIEENNRLREIRLKELEARHSAKRESDAREAVEREAEYMRDCAEREVLQRLEAEDCAARDSEEKHTLERAMLNHEQRYRKFEWKDMLSATSSFADDARIGMGANGAVYKGTLHRTTVAIKVLHSNDGHKIKQFNQELEVLSRIRHPHLLLLLGACLDHGCLVYEYMENGSLEDRLKCKNGSPALRWFHRFRIAWEVASALVFLHNSKPKPIVHRDLKPANILLDQNLVSKIGDVGLSTILPLVSPSMSTMCKQTAPVGTFCYIDPEYQRTGVVSPKSDIYGLGMVILQLLTGKPPMGLTHIVETAIDDGCLEEVLDTKAGKWPIEVTQELALLALNCVELRRKDRPDLEDKVLPTLERLKKIADDTRDSSHASSAPMHFICPILQEVMEDPCVAADGYTYDRKAIETWLSINDKSPLTNLPLPSKNLIPNHSLFSAIKEWKSRLDGTD